jgi:hypothetical protein
MEVVLSIPELVNLKIIKYIDSVEDKLKYINTISSSSAHYDYYIDILSNDYEWYMMRFMYDTGVLTKLAYHDSENMIYLDNYDIVKIIDNRTWGWEFDIACCIFEDLISEIIDNDKLINRIPETFIYARDMCKYYNEIQTYYRTHTDDIYNENMNVENEQYDYFGIFEDMDSDFYNFYGIDKYKNSYVSGYYSKIVDIDKDYLFVEELIEKYRI